MADASLMKGASALRYHVVGRTTHRLIDGEQHIQLRRRTTSHVPSKMLELDGHRSGILPYQLGQHGKCHDERLANRSVVGKAGGGMMPATAKVGSDLGHIEVTFGAQVAAHLGIAVDALRNRQTSTPITERTTSTRPSHSSEVTPQARGRSGTHSYMLRDRAPPS